MLVIAAIAPDGAESRLMPTPNVIPANAGIQGIGTDPVARSGVGAGIALDESRAHE